MRLSESELQRMSSEFGQTYVDRRFKIGSPVEKSLVLNTTGHGYYMGYRFAEKARDKWIRRFLPLDEDRIANHAKKAAQKYISKKGYARASFADIALIRATLIWGFVIGSKNCLGEDPLAT